MCRRRSPSVTMPTSAPPASTTPTTPKPLRLISISASAIGASGPISGISSPRVHQVADRRQPRPEPPARMQPAEVLRREGAMLHQRHRQRVAERQRHRRRGGRRQPDRAGLRRRRQHERDVRLPDQRASRACPPRRSAGCRTAGYRRSGRRAPASRPSSTAAAPRPRAVIIPRSPWLASAGCTNSAGVPVEASVAAILRATCPDLPMPETITRPRAAEHQRHRLGEARPERRGRDRPSAAASMPITRRPVAISCAGSSGGAAVHRAVSYARRCRPRPSRRGRAAPAPAGSRSRPAPAPSAPRGRAARRAPSRSRCR